MKIHITSTKALFAALFTLSAVGFSTGCTGGTGSAEDTGGGTPFVATPDSVGTIDVSVNDTALSVSDTSGFHVAVRDASGVPVSSIRVSCDTENGLALIEPSSGVEITDSGGGISGVVGCVTPGSYQMACRLPIGGNLRKFVTITCSGSAPAGFTGFDGAGGGGLGGAGGRGDDGSNPDANLRVSSILFSDGGDTGTRDIDTLRISDCDGDNTTVDPEPFSDSVIKVTIKNDTDSTYTFDSYRFVVPNGASGGGTYRSPSIALTGEEFDVAPGASKTYESIFAYQSTGGKSFVGTSDALSAVIGNGVPNVQFVIAGTDTEGNEITLTGSVALHIASFNRCS